MKIKHGSANKQNFLLFSSIAVREREREREREKMCNAYNFNETLNNTSNSIQYKKKRVASFIELFINTKYHFGQ